MVVLARIRALMEKSMKVSFPAMRGRIGQRTYYS